MTDAKSHIFISYSRVDKLVVEQISDLLSSAYEIWLDQRLVGGTDWWNEILEQITRCDHFIYLISRESIESEWCKKEFEEALRLEKHIIPIQIRARTNIPEKIQRFQLIDMSEGIVTKNISQLFTALINASKNKATPDIDEREISTDRKLLNFLWPLISIQNIRRLDDETQYHYIDKDFYDGTILQYLHLRDLYDNPQNVFFNPVLEQSFVTFDKILREYDKQRGFNAFSFEIVNGKNLYISDYKTCSTSKYGTPRASQEIINYKLGEYNKTVDLVLDVRQRHNELVAVVRSVFPDFIFSDENN